MRVVVAFTVVLAALDAQAADRLSLFAANPSWVKSSPSNTHWRGEMGLAYSHTWGERWSAEVGWSSGRFRERFYYVTKRPFEGTRFHPAERRITTRSAHLLIQYQFVNGSRWTPWIGGGTRWISLPSSEWRSYDLPDGLTVPYPPQSVEERMHGLVAGGITARVTRRIDVRLDLLGSIVQRDFDYDKRVRAQLGVGWRF